MCPSRSCQESLGCVILFIIQCSADGQSDCRAKGCLRKKKWSGRDEGKGEQRVASVDTKSGRYSSVRKGGNVTSHFPELRGFSDSVSCYSAAL